MYLVTDLDIEFFKWRQGRSAIKVDGGERWYWDPGQRGTYRVLITPVPQ